MKVAMVKQVLDVHGPWSGMLWKDTSPARLFDIWPGKLTFWGITSLLKADWYVIPQQLVSLYTHDAVFRHPGREEMVRQFTKNITATEDLPLGQYDMVITFDPILDVPKNSPTLFAYLGVEHWDQPYVRSMRKPLGNYDLFLAHMIDAHDKLTRIPQSISFPYMHDPVSAQSLFESVEKDDVAWVDWRALASLGMTEAWGAQNEAAARRFQDVIGIRIRYRGSVTFPSYSITDPPSWGDALVYLRYLAPCKYYIGAGRIHGGGQGAVDAAALNCICIGQSDKVYHRMLCHPEALCADMGELPRKMRKIVSSSDLQSEILAYQERTLNERFVAGPQNILEEALRMKRKRVG